MVFFSIVLVTILGCTEGGDNGNVANTSDTTNTTTTTTSTTTLRLKKIYDISFIGWGMGRLLDGDSLVIAGGKDSSATFTAEEDGPGWAGYRSNSAKAYRINFADESLAELSFDASSPSSPAPYGIGRGTTTLIHKLPGEKRYLLSGGYQYAATASVIDFSNNTTASISTDLSITDATGLNTTPFFTDRQGASAFGDGRVGFFGMNNGLYAMSYIAVFDPLTNAFALQNTRLTQSRQSVDAYRLLDGRIMLVGGFNGTWPDSLQAVKRVEIYDPVADTITRVSDFPGSHQWGQNASRPERISASGICVDDVQYSLANDAWTLDCNIPDRNAEGRYVVGLNASLPGGSGTGQYVGKTSTGDLVFISPDNAQRRVLIYSPN